jgi:hypothetical protein
VEEARIAACLLRILERRWPAAAAGESKLMANSEAKLQNLRVRADMMKTRQADHVRSGSALQVLESASPLSGGQSSLKEHLWTGLTLQIKTLFSVRFSISHHTADPGGLVIRTSLACNEL